MRKKEEGLTKSEFIHLFISLPTTEVCSLRDVSTKLLVHQIKSKIELRVGIPGDLIHLYFMNEELEDEKTLQNYKLKHGCILRVRLHKTWLGLFIACSKGDAFDVFQNGVQAITEDASNDFDVEIWNKLVIKRATFALFMATYHGYLSLMLELLNSSAADINGCTVFGRTALHIAAFQGFVGCVSLLLSEGAESSTLDVFGKTPLQLAHINRHVYCQKRLYMHQTSGMSHGRETRRPQTAPHQVMKNLHHNQRKKKSYSAKNTALRETSVESLPSLSIPCKNPSIPSQNPLNPSPPYDLPLMTIIEPLKSPPEEKNLSQDSTRSSTSRGIRGIEAILRTAEDDVVGEYHNINESIVDPDVTTLKITLPKEKNISTSFETEKTEINSASCDHNVPSEARGQFPPSKKMLGFVLTAEENRNVKKDRSSAECSKSEQQDDILETDQEKEDERLWTSSSHGYFESDDRLWTPSAFESVEEKRISQCHNPGASLSYNAWLEKKRQSAKETKTERPVSASAMRSKVGREMDVTAFKQWLESKKKFRKRSKSDSFTIEHHRSGSGMAFEEWLRQKRQQLNEAESPSHASDQADPRPKQACLGGKTFSEWLAEKKTLQQTCENVSTNNKRSKSRSGKTFREWLKDKDKEKHDQAIMQENFAISESQRKAFAEEQRRLNPRVKTFEQWFEEKQAQSVIELIQAKNAPDDAGLMNSKMKFPEDACLVYDMWLTSKHMEELKKEERLYEEMVETWRKKKEERLLIRRSILSKLSQAEK